MPKLSNPAKIGIGWTAAVSFGLFSFYIAKKNIDNNRYENMKARERIRQANQGEYVAERKSNIPDQVLNKSV